MKTMKPAVILGAAAVIVVIITVVILNMGGSGSGLYVSASSGDVKVTSEGAEPAALTADVFLKAGDTIEVGSSGSCTLEYRTKEKTEGNYVILSADTVAFISDSFNGKSDGTIDIVKGSALINSANSAKRNIIVRSDSVSATTKDAVIRFVCDQGGETTPSTEVISFSGNSSLQLYDNLGNPIDYNGNQGGKPEILGEGRGARILSGIQGGDPTFDYLNIPAELDKCDPITLKNLITIAAFHDLAFSSEDIKAAYDMAPASEAETEPEESETETETTTETTTTPTETEETTTPESSETTEPETTTERETERTTERVVTTTQYTTQYTTARVTTTADSVGTVYSFDPSIDDVEGPISDLDDIDIDDDDFDVDLDDDDDDEFNDEEIPFDDDESLEDDDDSWNDTEPLAARTHTVIFMVDGQRYTVSVADGGQAVPPVTPTQNDQGLPFLGWDQVLTDVHSDMTVNAMF